MLYFNRKFKFFWIYDLIQIFLTRTCSKIYLIFKNNC